MVAVRRPLAPHQPRAFRVLQRVVERKQWYFFLAGKRCDQLVQASDRPVCGRRSVVPRQDVGEEDAQVQLLSAPHHAPQVVGSAFHRAPLRDVVDSALDDENTRSGRALVEPSRDLIGALAVDAAVAEFEPRIAVRGPVLPLAALVERRTDPLLDARIRVPQGRPGRDGVAERGDDDPAQTASPADEYANSEAKAQLPASSHWNGSSSTLSSSA